MKLIFTKIRLRYAYGIVVLHMLLILHADLIACRLTFSAPENSNILVSDDQGNAITIRNGHKGSVGCDTTKNSFLIYTEKKQTRHGNDYELTFLVTERFCIEKGTKELDQKAKKENLLSYQMLEEASKVPALEQERANKRFIIEKTNKPPAGKKS